MTRRRVVVLVAMLLISWTALSKAHPMTIKGVVASVDRNRIEVQPLDDAGKPSGKAEWHALEPKVKVMRGDKMVSFAAAGIAKGERVVLIVDHGDDGKTTVVEVKLAAK